MKIRNTILLLALCIGISAQAQEETETPETSTPVIPVAESPSYLKKGAVGISMGTTGIGLEYAHNLSQHFNVRLRGSMFSISDYSMGMNVNNKDVIILANVAVKNVDLLVEFLPFKGNSFKLVGGGSYFIEGGGSAKINLDGELEYGDITLGSEDIGAITIGLDYSGFSPYFGFGFGRAVPKKRVGFSMEVGTYYAGSPKVSLEATEMFEPTAAEEHAELEENLSGFAWLPYITFKLAVKI